VSNTSWNPPTGPPNGAPVHPGDARREIDEAIEHARARDRDLRGQLVAAASARVQAADRLASATDEATEAHSLAKRALTRSNESARAGQRADAAKWTAAAEVFAMRLRNARADVVAAERRLAAVTEQGRLADRGLAENVGRLEALVAARLPMLSGRKAGRAQRDVDEVVAAIAVPATDLVARATHEARLAVDQAADDDAVAPVTDDDLESEVDYTGIDALLGELRTELGLPAPDPATAPSDPPPAPGPQGRGKGSGSSGRSWPVPAPAVRR
jgi:hypothetical protein